MATQIDQKEIDDYKQALVILKQNYDRKTGLKMAELKDILLYEVNKKWFANTANAIDGIQKERLTNLKGELNFLRSTIFLFKSKLNDLQKAKGDINYIKENLSFYKDLETDVEKAILIIGAIWDLNIIREFGNLKARKNLYKQLFNDAGHIDIEALKGQLALKINFVNTKLK